MSLQMSFSLDYNTIMKKNEYILIVWLSYNLTQYTTEKKIPKGSIFFCVWVNVYECICVYTHVHSCVC